MTLRRLFYSPGTGEIVLCLLGLVASLIPAVVYTYPFWGAKSYVDKELFSNEPPGVIVLQIHAGSPLEAAGMRPHDRVISFNGTPVQLGSFRDVLAKVKPGEPIAIEVKRDGKNICLEYQGETPKIEGVLYFDWQFVSAPAFFILFLLLVATQPLAPAPRWRAIIVCLVGLAIVTVTIVIELTQRLKPWTIVWQTLPIDRAPPLALHLTLVATVLFTSFALSLLGALGIRAFLLRGAHLQAKTNGSNPGNSDTADG